MLSYFGVRPPIGELGEEYIDPAYAPARESSAVVELRAVLFGSRPDALTQNYRLAQYLNILKASTWAPGYMGLLDPRETVRPASGIMDLEFGGSSQVIAGSGVSLDLAGDFCGDDQLGVNRNYFNLSFSPSFGVGQFRVKNYLGNDTISGLVSFNTAGGGWRTGAIPITGNVTAFISGRGAPSPAQFDLTLISRPSRTLPQILQQLVERGGTVAAICPNREPFKTFLNLFNDGPNLVERLSGVLLALGYHTYQQGR
jgi:hypothetical protein